MEKFTFVHSYSRWIILTNTCPFLEPKLILLKFLQTLWFYQFDKDIEIARICHHLIWNKRLYLNLDIWDSHRVFMGYDYVEIGPRLQRYVQIFFWKTNNWLFVVCRVTVILKSSITFLLKCFGPNWQTLE